MTPPLRSAPAVGRAPTLGRRLALLAGRSLYPLVALVLVLGTLLWGPWVTLVLTAAWWIAVTRWA
jgi:hypothetical protein